MAREAVSAARRGERVEARTERRERMATMRSRCQRGQFYTQGTHRVSFMFCSSIFWDVCF